MPAKKAIKAKPKGAARKRRERPSIPELILDGAEELFARAGYAGTTTRAIARRARINVGQLHYYFDSKRALFEAVVARHGAQITDARRRLLREAEAKWPRGNIPVEVLVEALVRSLLMEAKGSSAQRKASMRMHGRLHTDPDDSAAQARAAIYDDTTLAYVAAFRRALPKLPAEVVYWRVYFMMGAYVWTLLQPGRLETISQGACDPADMETAIQEIVPFLRAGLAAPVAK
jgi:AcrR family transcriptional regulator